MFEGERERRDVFDATRDEKDDEKITPETAGPGDRMPSAGGSRGDR